MNMADQTIRTLLVEPDADERYLIREMVSEASSIPFSWKAVERLSAAQEILRSEPFDLVLLDLALPDSRGPDTFLRLHPHALCLPVVVLTGMDDDLLAAQVVRAGAQDYLIRGEVHAEPFVRALRNAIERKQTEIALRVRNQQLAAWPGQPWSKDNPAPRVVGLLQELNGARAAISAQLAELLDQLPPTDPKRAAVLALRAQVERTWQRMESLLQASLRPAQPEPEDTADLAEYLRAHRIAAIQDNEAYFFKAIESELAGYVLKGSSLNELVSIMQLAVQAGLAVPRSLDPVLLDQYLQPAEAGRVSASIPLSPREHDVVRLVAQGRTNKEIAERMSISIRTVERHRTSVMNKLGLQNRAEMIAYAVRQGIVSQGGQES
jgi:DNA-binding NarL/FixJ family response regulator